MGSPAVITALETEVYTIPTDTPEADGTLSWNETVMVVVRARAGDHEGLGWTYGAAAAKHLVDDLLAPIVLGGDMTAVPAQHQAMTRAGRNVGRPGAFSHALSAVDIALWDLKARCLGCSLTDLWGATRDDAPIYWSGGFTTYTDDQMEAELHKGVGRDGIPRAKIKVGESWGSRESRDLERVALARSVIGPEVELYVDANGAYTAKQAVRLGRRMAREFGVTWLEEPISSDDLAGLRSVREQVEADVTAGEYGYTPDYYARMLGAQAVDCVQCDVTRCGGYTDWLAIAQLAAAHHLEISAHCAPNLHARAAVCVPNLRHLEYFHDHVRIEEELFDGALVPEGGSLRPRRDVPGHGMSLRAAAADAYRTK